MKKLFVCSDLHGFANEFEASLSLAKFEINNPNHLLVVIGDVFDRGSKAVRIYELLKDIKNKILIKGNHEGIFKKLLKKKIPHYTDFSNGTVDTFIQFAVDQAKKEKINLKDLKEITSKYLRSAFEYAAAFGSDPDIDVQSDWNTIRALVKRHEVVKWLNSKEWKNYYEYDKYIFTHCFIPVNLKPEAVKKYGMQSYGLENPNYFKYTPNWRDLPNDAWEQASWGCPWSSFDAGLFNEEAKKGKVLVVGHWYTDDFFRHLKNNSGHDGEIYFSEHLIGIDGGTSSYVKNFEEIFIHHQNVLVIDGDKCYTEYGKELKEIRRVPIIETISESDLTEEEREQLKKTEEEENEKE